MEQKDNKKAVLDTELLVLHMLDELRKEEIINMATYGKALKEVKGNGTNN